MNRLFITHYRLIVLSLSAICLPLLAQTWTDVQGRSIEAEFISLEIQDSQPSGIHVNRQGQTLFIKWELLSQESQQQAQQLQIKQLDAQTTIYNAVVFPILNSSCSDCHSDSKQKGELRTDSYAALLEGGESGAALIPGNTKKSTLIERITLPAGHEDIMPPKKKQPLGKLEIDFLTWWVKNGGSDKTLLPDLPDKYEELID